MDKKALYPSHKAIKQCRQFRQKPTDAEDKLWAHLRARRLNGFKFRRQHPIGGHFLDFYCEELKLGVEVDGGGHLEPEQEAHDQTRSQNLGQLGIRIMRFWDDEVLNDIDNVLEEIMSSITNRPSPHPLPRVGEGVEPISHS